MPPTNSPKNSTVIASDDTPEVRREKMAAAAEREREAADEAAEEKRKADEKAAADAEAAGKKKPAQAAAETHAGSETPAGTGKDAPKQTSFRPGELVKAGQSGGGAGRSSKLTRAQMEAVIKGGGSVLHGGVIHTQAGTLPAEADLVAGDAEAEKRVAETLDTQIAALQAQRDKLSKK